MSMLRDEIGMSATKAILKPDPKDSVSGIYCIENTRDGKKYIGKSKNVYKRIHQHKYDILNDRYRNENEYFRRAVKKYGIDSFVYYVLEEVDIHKLSSREIYWMEKCQSLERSKGYNLRKDSSSGMEVSKSTSDKISRRLKKEWEIGIRSGHSVKMKESWKNCDDGRREAQSKCMSQNKTNYSYNITKADGSVLKNILYKELDSLGLKNCTVTFHRKGCNKIKFKGFFIERIEIEKDEIILGTKK